MASPVGHRVIVADRHPALRLGITGLVRRMGPMTVCGEAGDVAEAWELFNRLHPDVVVMDVDFPDGDGIHLAQRMIAKRPQVAILILSHHDEPLYAARALSAGALAYVKKDDDLKCLVQALSKVSQHGKYLSRSYRSHVLLKALLHTEGGPCGLLAPLSKREADVFRCLGQGMDNQRIAEHLDLGLKTVNSHRASIRKKLHLPDAVATTRLAKEWQAMESTPLPSQ